MVVRRLNLKEVLEASKDALSAIGKALDKGNITCDTPEGVLRAIISNPINNHLWLVEDEVGSIAYVCSKYYTQQNGAIAFSVYAMAYTSNREVEYLHLFENLEGIARLEGAKVVRVEGRIGWKKKLRHLDYEFDYAVFSKEL